jgi:hypothetical protein
MKKAQKKTNRRAIISIGLSISLVMMPVTGILIHTNHSTVASSHLWLHIHVFSGIFFTIFGILHLTYNWLILKHYMKSKK